MTTPPPPPNILLIIADDLRPELGCYDSPYVLSPNIDALASGGVVFRRAYCNVPVSGASRASFLTGLYPDLPERFNRFDAWAEKDAPGAVTVPGWFKSNGFTSKSIGKVFHNIDDCSGDWSSYPWRTHPDGYGKDWAVYNKWELWQNEESGNHINARTGRGPFFECADVPDTAYNDGLVAREAVRQLGEFSRTGERFFLAVGFWRPHLPYNAPKKYWDMYDGDSIPLAPNRFRPEGLPEQVKNSGEVRGWALVNSPEDEQFQRKGRHGYFACISYLDAQLGLIMDELERTGLDRNTVVVFLGDHGYHLGEHNFWGKHNLMHHSTNAPLIVKVPGGRSGESFSPAEFVDLFPTLCDLAGIPAPGGIHGTSLARTVRHPDVRTKRYAVIQWADGVCVADRRYSYSVWFSDDGKVDAEMLFDHKRDPQENMNVAGQRKYRPAVRRLRRKAESSLESI